MIYSIIQHTKALLLCVFISIPVFAQTTPVWNSATSGTLDDVNFTITGLNGSRLGTSDLSGSDFSFAPLSSNQTILGCESRSDWTITFDSPIKDFRLYIRSWRNGSGGNTSGTLSQSGTKLSGSNFNVTGTNISVTSNFGAGIIEIVGEVTSLSYNASSGFSEVVMTFTGTDASPPVPTLSEWGLLNLALLLMICGTLSLIKENKFKNSIYNECVF